MQLDLVSMFGWSKSYFIRKTGSIPESKGIVWFFVKKTKKDKIFEDLGKNVQNLKIFWKRAGDCVQLLHAINC